MCAAWLVIRVADTVGEAVTVTRDTDGDNGGNGVGHLDGEPIGNMDGDAVGDMIAEALLGKGKGRGEGEGACM